MKPKCNKQLTNNCKDNNHIKKITELLAFRFTSGLWLDLRERVTK